MPSTDTALFTVTDSAAICSSSTHSQTDGINTLDVASAVGLFDQQDASHLPSHLVLHEASVALAISKAYPTSDDFRTVVSTRLQYTIHELARAPHRTVHENGTPWCHPSLYADEMPRPMQDAQACCALYLAKRDANAHAVLGTVEGRAAELAAAAPPPPGTARLVDLLARAHALLLYQIIRLFDNDLALRAGPGAAAHTAALQAAVFRLQDGLLRQPPPRPAGAPAPLPLFPLGAARAAWTAWVQCESARRTVLIGSVVAQLYRRVRGPAAAVPCDAALWWCEWTPSAGLWRSEDAAEFAVAWNRSRREPVTVAGFVGGLAEVEADDVDVFGRMLLTPLLGIDEAKGWFLSKGGEL